jgi:uncharacterized peroxidase-related enzyme
MKLPGIHKGASFGQKLRLGIVRFAQRDEPSDVLKALFYRPDLFGAPIGRYCHALLRGPSEWTLGERELFATFVSHCNRCAFCTGMHQAVAIRALGAEVVNSVLADYRTAPVSEGVRAVLAFLDKLSKDPTGIGRTDLEATLNHGVSLSALETAVHIAAVFNVINRVADAMGFDIPPASVVAKEAESLLKRGYAPMPF